MLENENTNELGLISLEEGAELLGEGIVTFKKKIDDGKIPAIQISDKIRKVRKQDVLDFVNNQVKKPETSNSDSLSKVKEQIELADATQLLEAKKAGFKTSDDFKKAFETVENIKVKQDAERKSLEIRIKEFESYKLHEQGLIDDAKAKNIDNANKVKEIGEEYKKKWKLEDEKRQNENKLILTHLDELSKTVYNMHPQYLGKLAKEKLSEHLEPILAYYGVPPAFSSKNEYIPLSQRLELMETHHDITTQRNDKESMNDLEIVQNIKKSYDQILTFYKWVVRTSGGYDFALWLYKELNTLGELIDNQETGSILNNRNTIMEHFGAINSGMVSLAQKFDSSNHPNNVTDSSSMEYILKVSDEIERLLGVRNDD